MYMPDPIRDPTLIRGVGTHFDTEAEVGGMIFLPAVKNQASTNVDIAEILGPDAIRTKRPFKTKLALSQLTARDDIDEAGNFTNMDLTGPKEGYQGTPYKLAPRIDQTKVYEAVFNRLRNGGCVGIFPEGGSHDRTGLLPIKAGVAIMALGAMADSPNIDLKIVPVGMNYFHAHKFRSRAVVEFGQPIEIPTELVDMYQHGQRREAIGALLDTVYQGLAAVTVQTPDYDTLMLIQAARRLYKPTGKKLPLPYVVELNRRLAMGYERYKDDPRIAQISQDVKEYNKQLRYLNIRDHQVQYTRMPIHTVIFTTIYRVLKLLVLLIGTLPGLMLFTPVFVLTKYISIRKAREALAGSTVKIQGRDVMATWKIMTALFFAPILYNTYICIFVWRVYADRLWGYWDYVPRWIPLWTAFPIGWILFPLITFAALRFGEVGMDIFKSLRPLVMCLNPASNYNIHQLRERRAALSERVTNVINELGPEMFSDFDKTRIVADPLKDKSSMRRRDSEMSMSSSTGGIEGPDSPTRPLARRDTTSSSRGLPKNESYSNIGKVGLFSTRPPSRSRSRSSSSGGAFGSAGFPVSAFTTLDSQAGLDEVSRKIREEMRERGEVRRRKSQGKKAFELQADESDEEEEDGKSDVSGKEGKYA